MLNIEPITAHGSRRHTSLRFAAWVGAITCSTSLASLAHAEVTTAAELVDAVTNGAPGDIVELAPGTYEIDEPLRPPPGMQIQGAGVGLTILQNAPGWAPGTAGLDQDEGATAGAIDCDNYLFDLGSDSVDVVISDMTLTGPLLHGGICGFGMSGLELARLEFTTFLWAGLRAFIMEGALIHDNQFFDAGGKSNITSGSSGGALFLTYTSSSEIYDNHFARSEGNDGYGVKGREARSVRIHHNTIATNFAIELPFENDHFVEIDHNYLGGAISIPKFGGGGFPKGGYTFHVHHNYFVTSYALEYQRNGIEIDHNLFDFSTDADGGNLISSFDSVPAVGGTKMHDNLISNPGRGLYWNEGVYDDFAFYNDHVRGTTTVTPRTEGLFEFRPERDGTATDWDSIVLRDNIIELTGTFRPLMRNAQSYAADIENNTLVGVSDDDAYANPDSGQPRGPLEPLCMRLGAHEEWTVDGWTVSKTPRPVPAGECGEIEPGGSGGSSGSSGSSSDGPPDDDTTTTAGGESGVEASAGSTGGGVSSGSTESSAAADEDGGCACRSTSRDPSGSAAVLLVMLGLWGTRRRQVKTTPAATRAVTTGSAPISGPTDTVANIL